MYLYIFDDNFNRLSVLSNYTEVEITRNYYSHSAMIIYIDATQKNIGLFINQEEDRIITKSTDLKRGYIVEYADFTDDSKTEIMLRALSLSIFTSWRIIEGQQRYTGNIETVIKSFVSTNAINPTNRNRIIPNLILGMNTGINIYVDEMYNNKQLDEALWEICQKNEISFEILMNHETRKYEFITYCGADRSTEQYENPHIIFSKSFRNVNTQSFVDDKSNYKSTAYVAGEGEGAGRITLQLNGSLTGFKRREIYFDARDLQSKYTDDEGQEITIPQAEYLALLQDRGLNRLVDYMRIQTFKSDTDSTSQYKFDEDYFLGDKTTSRSDVLNLVVHSRVVVAKEIYTREGYSIQLEFGSSTPNFFEKVKKELKNVASGGSSVSGNSPTKISQLTNDSGYVTIEEIKPYVHSQVSPSVSWIVNHNLNKYPNVTVTDSADNVMLADVQYINLNTIKIDFGFAFSGKAICI